MKLKNLDKEMLTITGARIMMSANRPMTYRSALISACETYQGQPGSGDNIKAFDLGIKIMNAKDELEISDEDQKFLLRVIDGNQAFMAVVVGRLHEFINIK